MTKREDTKPGSAAPTKAGSGEHALVIACRAKFDSITNVTLPLTRALNKRIDRARRTIGQTPKDPDTDPDLVLHIDLNGEENDGGEAPPTSSTP